MVMYDTINVKKIGKKYRASFKTWLKDSPKMKIDAELWADDLNSLRTKCNAFFGRVVLIACKTT